MLAVGAALVAPAANAQQVLQIDTAVGRVILDDEWRAIRTIGDMPLDRTRAILYANDDEEPEAVMAFSLETGEWIRTIPGSAASRAPGCCRRWRVSGKDTRPAYSIPQGLPASRIASPAPSSE